MTFNQFIEGCELVAVITAFTAFLAVVARLVERLTRPDPKMPELPPLQGYAEGALRIAAEAEEAAQERIRKLRIAAEAEEAAQERIRKLREDAARDGIPTWKQVEAFTAEIKDKQDTLREIECYLHGLETMLRSVSGHQYDYFTDPRHRDAEKDVCHQCGAPGAQIRNDLRCFGYTWKSFHGEKW